MDGNGEEERGGTFSSKKVDWTQEPGSPRGKRETEKTRGQITSSYSTFRPFRCRYPIPKPPSAQASDKQQSP